MEAYMYKGSIKLERTLRGEKYSYINIQSDEYTLTTCMLMFLNVISVYTNIYSSAS